MNANMFQLRDELEAARRNLNLAEIEVETLRQARENLVVPSGLTWHGGFTRYHFSEETILAALEAEIQTCLADIKKARGKDAKQPIRERMVSLMDAKRNPISEGHRRRNFAISAETAIESRLLAAQDEANRQQQLVEQLTSDISGEETRIKELLCGKNLELDNFARRRLESELAAFQPWCIARAKAAFLAHPGHRHEIPRVSSSIGFKRVTVSVTSEHSTQNLFMSFSLLGSSSINWSKPKRR